MDHERPQDVQYQLRPFTKEQTGCYIDVQMKQAGGPEDVFDAAVKESFSFDLLLKSTQPIKDIRQPGYPHALIEEVSDPEVESTNG